jgi:hypothetical protein
MSFLGVTPDVLTAASGNLENIGTSLRAAHAAAAAQTTAIVAPAADEVSEAITSLFGTAAQEYQALGAQAAAFHENFVSTLSAGAGQYVGAEAANVRQTVAVAASAVTQTINTPIGPLSVSLGSNLLPPSGANGPFSVFANASSTLLGSGTVTATGNFLAGPYGPGTQIQVTGATLNAPGLLNGLVAFAGPGVATNISLFNSVSTLVSDLQTGNVLGAAITALNAPGNLLTAATIGSTTVNVSIDTAPFGGPVGTLSIPFNGIFASPQPITATWPTFDISNGGTTYQVDGVTNLPIGSSSGFVPYLLDGIAGLLGL